MNSRTVRDFKVPTDIWKFVDDWARTEGFELAANGDRRLYKKEFGKFSPSSWVEIRESGGDVHLEAWLHNPPAARALTLFTTPEELPVDSSGPQKALVARNISRDRVNRLLIKLGQPLIS
ncbi:MAG: hypothetical protein ACK4S4_05660 [Pyrinomonadaceae bacterium]